MPIYDAQGNLPTKQWPRIGKIRLGIKVEENGRTFPRAMDHFVLNDDDGCKELREFLLATLAPEDLCEEHGLPTVIDPIWFPSDDEEMVAPHYMRMYGQTWGLSCIGDGRTARRRIDVARTKETGEPIVATHDTAKAEGSTEWKDNLSICGDQCPYFHKQCQPMLYLRFMLPEVPGADVGFFQISTKSINAIQSIGGTMNMLRMTSPRKTITDRFLALTMSKQAIGTPTGIRRTTIMTLGASRAAGQVQTLMEAVKAPHPLMLNTGIEFEIGLAEEDEAADDAVQGEVITPDAEEADFASKEEIAKKVNDASDDMYQGRKPAPAAKDKTAGEITADKAAIARAQEMGKLAGEFKVSRQTITAHIQMEHKKDEARQLTEEEAGVTLKYIRALALEARGATHEMAPHEVADVLGEDLPSYLDGDEHFRDGIAMIDAAATKRDFEAQNTQPYTENEGQETEPPADQETETRSTYRQAVDAGNFDEGQRAHDEQQAQEGAEAHDAAAAQDPLQPTLGDEPEGLPF